MTAQSFHISLRSSSLHYLRWGSGAEWLFCFHGYGEDASSFDALAAQLGDRFTIIAIDMPYHGRTAWNEGLLFEPADLVNVMHSILPPGERFSLFGYSMGGRVCMQLLEDIPGEIDKLVLAAPDGLHRNKWQWLATHTRVGNRMFAHAMRRPAWMMAVLAMAAKLKLYNTSLLKFVHYYLDDQQQRETLYRRWTAMRRFRPSPSVIARIVKKYRIPVHMVFGKYDKVILAKHGRSLAAKAERWISVEEIEAGHRLLREPYIQTIVSMLRR